MFSRYLGDGVYAIFDGMQIWLRTDDAACRIALEPAVMEELQNYYADIQKKSAKVLNEMFPPEEEWMTNMNDTQKEIGQLCSAEHQRDAIHVAVIPAQVGKNALHPGQKVMMVNGLASTTNWDHHAYVGVVDPYLRHNVKPGEWFWLFLRPNTITGLRHAWSHPQFPADAVISAPRDKAWLRNFCKDAAIDYDDFLGAGRVHRSGNIGLSFGTPDELYDDEKRQLVLMHLSNVLGHEIDPETRFSCSC